MRRVSLALALLQIDWSSAFPAALSPLGLALVRVETAGLAATKGRPPSHRRVPGARRPAASHEAVSPVVASPPLLPASNPRATALTRLPRDSGNGTRSSATTVPAHRARAIWFSDKDMKANLLHGTISIRRAKDELDVSHYNIHWAANGTARALIMSLPKTRASLEYLLQDPSHPGSGVRIPSGVNQVVVLTANEVGSMNEGPTVDLYDHVEPPLGEIFQGLLRGGG